MNLDRIKYFCLAVFLVFYCSMHLPLSVRANENLDHLETPSFVLMEASTGQVIVERESDIRRSPASITKIMTLYLIFEALENGSIQLSDEVTTSSHARSMGGSQVFLEEGEKQTVDTLIKCITVASGNDACVVMAEYIAGSEQEFVNRMNQKAAEIGLKNSHFLDCSGLSDSDDHYMSAMDIAILAKKLITKYPAVFRYSGIWMEDITHVTNKGSEKFTLANTNKLLKQYSFTTGLKTGSTSKAKYCLCATAKQNDMELIAVVMAAPDFKKRFSEAKELLEYGYQNCSLYRDLEPISEKNLPLVGALKDDVTVAPEEEFYYLNTNGNQCEGISKEIILADFIEAPVEKGDTLGCVSYFLSGKEIGRVSIISKETVKRATYGDCVKKILLFSF